MSKTGTRYPFDQAMDIGQVYFEEDNKASVKLYYDGFSRNIHLYCKYLWNHQCIKTISPIRPGDVVGRTIIGKPIFVGSLYLEGIFMF